MSIIVSGLLGSFLVTMGYGAEPSVCAYAFIELDIENNVLPTNKYIPLTGVHAVEEEIEGWQWDRRLLSHNRNARTRYDTYLGGHSIGLKDGTQQTDWQSGSISGTKYNGIVRFKDGEFRTWTPQVGTGAYSIYHDSRPLFSDYSTSQNFDINNNANGVNVLTMNSESVHSTAHVALYERDSLLRIFKKYDFKYVSAFTGEISGVARLATVDGGGSIIYANLAGRKQEFLISGDDVILNGDWSIEVGNLVLSPTILTLGSIPECAVDLLECKGEGTASGRRIYTDLFPLQPLSVSVFVDDGAATLSQYTETTSLDFSLPTDTHFSVDSDLGIITMGGFQAPDLVLKTALVVTDDEVICYEADDTFAQYPEQGVIVVGTEEILYLEKRRNSVADLIRGYNATVAVVASPGDTVADRRHGLGTADTVYLAYTAVPRIDYEVTNYALRSANKGPWLDIRPGANVDTNNILQILSAEIDLAEIVLTTDSELIGGNLYGPVFYGTDVSRLTATGYDSRGNPVDNVTLSIEIVSGAGALNGGLSVFTDVSNTRGEIYAFYNSPYNKDSIETLVSSVSYSGGDTIFDVGPNLNTSLVEDIWVFQVLKHDKTLGTVGLERVIEDVAVEVPPIGLSSIRIDGLVGEEYQNGFAYFVGTDSVRYFRRIKGIFPDVDGSGRPVSRLYLEENTSIALATGQPVFLFEADATEFNSAALNGVRNILYEFNNAVTHPITGALGAWSPVHPDSISGSTLTFTGRTLATPDSGDDTENLAAYVVIAPTEVSVQAYGTDPITGRVIRSNTIRLTLQLPNFLIGVDTSGALPIPYGWTLVTESFNTGAGVGGANFLTVNPAASGINQFTITGQI